MSLDLEFQDVHDKWKELPFYEMFSFLKNNSLPRAELNHKGKVKNVHYGDILIKFDHLLDISNQELPSILDEKVGEYLAKRGTLQNGDIVFADAAEDLTVGKCIEIINLGKENVVSGLHTIPCRPLIPIRNGFLGYCLNSPKFHNQLIPLIQGSKISSLSKAAVQQTTIFFPQSEIEQLKIYSFFKVIGEKISASEKKVSSLKQLKEATLISMFPQGGETKPRVRFKGFEEEWNIVKLKDISVKIMNKNRNLTNSITLTNSAEFGVIAQLDFFSHEVSKILNTFNYFIVENNDFVYNPRVSVSAPVGPINRNKLGYTGIVSPLYLVFRVVHTNLDYIETYFKTSLWHKYLKDKDYNRKFPHFVEQIYTF